MTRAEKILEIAAAAAALGAAGAIGSQYVQKRIQDRRRDDKVRQAGLGTQLDHAKKNLSQTRRREFLRLNPAKARRNVQHAKTQHQHVINKGLARQARLLSGVKDHERQTELNQ